MNCIIVDDEYPAREELKYFIKKYSSIQILREFDDSMDALKYLEKNMPDVIFLDINMPKLDGISLSRIINNFEKKPKILFNTAYKEYAVDAFEIKAFDYILKPYSEERIIEALKRLEESDEVKLKPLNSKIALKKDNKIVVIDIDDIFYCEAQERETIVYTETGFYTASLSISQFFEKLSNSNNFFKSHRSYIVNLDKISEIIPWFNNTYMIKLKKLDAQVPVSRNNVNEFKYIMGL